MTKTNKTKKLKAGVFIDGANLYYAQKKAGWKVDLKKLVKILSKEVKVQLVNYYTAMPAKWDESYKGSLKFLNKLDKSITIVEKNLKYIRTPTGLIKKGDVDLELALGVVRYLDKLDLVIVVSGDSDYVDLRKYVLESNKKIIFLSFKENLSWEIKQGKYLVINQLKRYIKLSKKTTPRYYPGRLLLPILYHKKNNKSSKNETTI